MPDLIDLNELEESALETAWNRIGPTLQKAFQKKKPLPLQPDDATIEDPPDLLEAAFAHDIFSPKAQAVLDRMVEVSREMTVSARARLAEVLEIEDAGDRAHGILDFIADYRIRLANLLTAGQLAALLQGASEVVRDLPSAPAPGVGAPLPPTLALETAAGIVRELRDLTPLQREVRLYEMTPTHAEFIRGALAGASGGIEPPWIATIKTDGISLPIIEEAARLLAGKNVLDRRRFDALEAAARAKAFTVASVETDATLYKIRDSLAQSIAEGVDYATWRKEILAAVDEGTFLSDSHMEVVYRTNVQTAFSDGQMNVLSHPFIRQGFPYASYEAIHDDRVRPEHLAMETYGLEGTNIYRIEDKVFQTFRPPFSWACRCSWLAMGVQDAADKGLAEAKRWVATGVEPTPVFVKPPPFSPPPGFQRSISGAPLSIQLSLQPLEFLPPMVDVIAGEFGLDADILDAAVYYAAARQRVPANLEFPLDSYPWDD